MPERAQNPAQMKDDAVNDQRMEGAGVEGYARPPMVRLRAGRVVDLRGLELVLEGERMLEQRLEFLADKEFLEDRGAADPGRADAVHSRLLLATRVQSRDPRNSRST